MQKRGGAHGGRDFYRVIYGDTDCGGVMYYANYLRLFEMGRTELIRAYGLSYKEIEEEMGIILPVVEVKARYKASAKYDDLLRIRTTLVEARSFKILLLIRYSGRKPSL